MRKAKEEERLLDRIVERTEGERAFQREGPILMETETETETERERDRERERERQRERDRDRETETETDRQTIIFPGVCTTVIPVLSVFQILFAV